MKKEDCIFCKIVKGESPCYKVLEDEKHLAFLSIFPNTDGFTVVITKEHFSSYGFANTDQTLGELVLFSKKVAQLIDKAFEDVGRTALMMEGFGVDHLHVKLFPMHGTNSEVWRQYSSTMNKFFKEYEGYISSHDCERADDKYLENIAAKIRKAI
ncbi:MAG: HIT family protein [Candidatus Dojkabacteria bacterium]